MKQIEAHQVKRDNSNIRNYSDKMWRVLRKERFKKSNPDLMTNQMAAEQFVLNTSCDYNFIWDMQKFMHEYLSERETTLFSYWLFGGSITQKELGEDLGITQGLVSTELKLILSKVKEYYYKDLTKKEHIDEYLEEIKE